MEGWSREGGMNEWIRCRFSLSYRKEKKGVVADPLPA